MEHSILIDLLLLITGIYLGIYIAYFYIKRTYKKELDTQKKKVKSVYSEIFDNISNKNLTFKYRIDNIVKFDTTTKILGDISVYFYLSKTEIVIFKNDEAIHTSKELEVNFINELDYLLKVTLSNEINDTLTIFGSIYSRNYFNSTHKINLEDYGVSKEDTQTYDEDYNIDNILDKINIVGYNKLSIKEKEFLKKYSNE